jgi:hypothetical protein
MPDEFDRPVLAEFGKGCCINCGFLAKRDITLHNEDVRRVTVGERMAGKTRCLRVSHPAGTPEMETENFAPYCAKRVVDLVGEAKALDTYGEENEGQYHYWTGLSPLYRKDRNCPLWYPWREDLSPKEHLEEYRMRLLEEQRRAYEKRIEGERRRFELILFGVAIVAAASEVVVSVIAIIIATR